MARKPKIKAPGWKIEVFASEQWLWVMLPDFPTPEAAEAWKIQALTRTPNANYRVLPS